MPKIAIAHLVALATLAWPSTSGAQASTHVSHVHVTPTHLKAGEQYYEASPAGMREYLRSIRAVHPEVFKALDADVRDLESRLTTGTALFWSGLVAGPVIMFSGFLFWDDCSKYDALSSEYDDCDDSNLTTITITGGLGAAVMLGGMLSGIAIRPDRDDMLTVINKHNRIAPDTPIDLRLGYDPARSLVAGDVILRF